MYGAFALDFACERCHFAVGSEYASATRNGKTAYYCHYSIPHPYKVDCYSLSLRANFPELGDPPVVRPNSMSPGIYELSYLQELVDKARDNGHWLTA